MRFGSPPRHHAENPRRMPVRKIAGVAMAAAALVWATGSLANASVSTDGYYYNDGDTVQITGDQMAAGENVTVDVDLPDGSLSQEHVVVADANGDFSDSYTLALDAPPGIYTVVATGESSGSVFTTTFDPFVLTINLSPATLTVGDSTTISGNLSNNGSPSTDTRTVTLTLYSDSACTKSSATIGTADTDAAGNYSFPNYTPPAGTWYVGGAVTQGKTSACSGTLVVGSGNTSGSATVDAGGPYSGAEGDVIGLTGAAVTGGSTNPHYAWTVDTTGLISGDTAADPSASCSFTPSNAVLNPSVSCTDDTNGGQFTLTLSYYDDSNGSSSSPLTDTAPLTLTNAAPVVSTPSATSTNCTVSVSAAFTDAGLNDSHTASISWGDSASSSGSVIEPTSTSAGSVTGSHTYGGPGSYDIKVSVLDDDGDSGNATLSGYVLANPTVSNPLPPIMAGKTFNTGSTIPVKISVVGCTTGVTAVVTIAKVGGTPFVPAPAGKSGSDGVMRYTGDLPGFIYNWQTKGLSTGQYVVSVLVSGLANGGTANPSAIVTLTK